MNLAQLPRIILAFIFLIAPLHLHGQSPRWTVGMSQCNLGEPWRVQMNADIKRAAEAHPELKVVFKDAQNDNLRQASHIDEFTRARVNLIIISPKEAAPLTAPVAEAFRKGIPVIVLDRRVLGDQYTCFIGADNRKIGRAAGRWIAKLLSGKGNVVELKGLMTSTPGQDRNAGFREGIKGSGISVGVRGRHEMARTEREKGDGIGARTFSIPGSRLRPQRSRGAWSLPGGKGGRTGEEDRVRRHRWSAAGGTDVRQTGDPLGKFRIPHRRP